jgi:phospholipid/cholesterol/gamma-HCH transport system substrate-binding protein
MATRAQKVRLAIFLVFAASVLGGFLLIVAGAQLLRQRITYYVQFEESVGGLVSGDPVKYQGITVGRVEDTRVSASDISNIIVEISLEARKVPNVIRQNTEVYLYGQGVTGFKYIELQAGASDAPVLAHGDTLPAKATFLSSLEERTELLTTRIEALLLNLTEMTGSENQRKMGRMITAGTELMESTNALVSDNKSDLDTIVSNLAAVTGNLAATTGSMQGLMDSLHSLAASEDTRGTLRDLRLTTAAVRLQLEGPLPTLIHSLNRMAGRIDTTALHIDRTVLQGRKDILDAMEHLEETMLNVQETTELIRENPEILIRGRADQ